MDRELEIAWIIIITYTIVGSNVNGMRALWIQNITQGKYLYEPDIEILIAICVRFMKK
jgi:hypothetical protein